MTNPDDNLPPQTSKFFDIIPANKRSSASPTSRPLIVDNSPTQTDSMINTDQQPDLPEVVPEEQPTIEPAPVEPVETPVEEPDDAEIPVDDQPIPEPGDLKPEETDVQTSLPEENISPVETDIQPVAETDDFPVVQTDIETAPEEGNSTAVETGSGSTITTDQPADEELLLPAEATPDEVTANEGVVIHSQGVSPKAFRVRSWLIVLLFVIIIIIIGLVLYLFVFKSTATTTPNTQFFGSL
jgi:hypothetical protein